MLPYPYHSCQLDSTMDLCHQ